MADSIELRKGGACAEDLLQAADSTPQSQNRLNNTGAEVATPVTPINDDALYTSNATLAVFPGKTRIGQALRYLATLIAFASTSASGLVYRMSAAPAVGGQPIAMEQNDPAISRIPGIAQSLALNGSSKTPSASNYFPLLQDMQGWNPEYGDGSDGVATVGAITGALSAPSGLAKQSSGNITGDRYYKVAAGNLSGTTAASTASTVLTLASENAVVPLPTTGLVNCQWLFIYASSTVGGTYYEVGRALYGTASFTDRTATLGGTRTAPAADTSGAASGTFSGCLNFSDMPTGCWGGGFTLTIDNSGPFAGRLTVRSQTQYNDASLTVSGTGTFRAVGYNGRDICDATYGTTRAAPGVTVTTSWVDVNAGVGVGLVPFAKFNPGFGKAGQPSGTITPAAGGYAGGDYQFFAPRVAGGLLRGAYNLRGQTPAAATGGSGSYCCGGAGGGGGGRFRGVTESPCAGSATIDVRGGDGGPAAGAGGASTSSGGGPGGGGIVELIGPNWVTTGMTLSYIAGSAGASNATGNAAGSSGGGGAYAGNGGAGGSAGAAPGAGGTGGLITAQTYNGAHRYGLIA